MKERLSLPLVLAVLAGIILLGTTTVVLANHFATKQLDKNTLTDKQCLKFKTEDHTILIQNGIANPKSVNAKQCDQLTIMNQDDRNRLMAFGAHDAHIYYDGVEQQVLVKNQSFSVTLVKTGKFTVHDHNDDSVEATFTVEAR